MEASCCTLCSSKKAPLVCDICASPVCKSCVERIDHVSLSFLTVVPKVLEHENICSRCFDQHVAAEKARCDDLMEKAKEVYFLTKNFRGNVRISGRHTKRVATQKCSDRRECILRLAFYAAELGFNAIIEADVESSKIVMGKYQSAEWKGSAMPANIDGEHLERASLRGF